MGLLVVGTAEYVVSAPDTGAMVAQLVPAPWSQLAPIGLGLLYAVLVHQVPNAPKPGEAGALTVAQADAVKRLVESHARHLAAAAGSRAQTITTVASPATGLVQLTSPPPRPQPRAGVGGN